MKILLIILVIIFFVPLLKLTWWITGRLLSLINSLFKYGFLLLYWLSFVIVYEFNNWVLKPIKEKTIKRFFKKEQ